MKKNLKVMLAILSLAQVPALSAAETKIGVVDYQEVLEATEDGKAAKGKLEKLISDKKKDVDSKKSEFEKLRDNYDKQKLVMSKDSLASKEKELQTKGFELQQYAAQAEQDVAKKEMELKQDILKKIRAVVEKIGQKENYSVIAEKNEGGIIFNLNTLDITKQVIAEYNQAYKSPKGK